MRIAYNLQGQAVDREQANASLLLVVRLDNLIVAVLCEQSDVVSVTHHVKLRQLLSPRHWRVFCARRTASQNNQANHRPSKHQRPPAAKAASDRYSRGENTCSIAQG